MAADDSDPARDRRIRLLRGLFLFDIVIGIALAAAAEPLFGIVELIPAGLLVSALGIAAYLLVPRMVKPSAGT